MNREREVVFWRSGGREFQTRGAERMNARLPVVVRRTEGKERWREEEDLRERGGMAIWRRWDEQGGGGCGRL